MVFLWAFKFKSWCRSARAGRQISLPSPSTAWHGAVSRGVAHAHTCVRVASTVTRARGRTRIRTHARPSSHAYVLELRMHTSSLRRIGRSACGDGKRGRVESGGAATLFPQDTGLLGAVQPKPKATEGYGAAVHASPCQQPRFLRSSLPPLLSEDGVSPFGIPVLTEATLRHEHTLIENGRRSTQKLRPQRGRRGVGEPPVAETPSTCAGTESNRCSPWACRAESSS
mmetsp:Transcript_18418/g.58746  ORF Transcript_18418/g.58746 Transcript_18418/m.58746 type:complete len:227 (+) Transcript_18418:1334-2014(+)